MQSSGFPLLLRTLLRVCKSLAYMSYVTSQISFYILQYEPVEIHIFPSSRFEQEPPVTCERLWVYTVLDGALPNTGVTTGLSKEEASKASISVFTAARASGCVNKKPSSQNEAGPTLPCKTKG